MSQPFIGEIRMFGGNFAPVNWMLCEGQELPISQYSTLFDLIGTTYGGNGTTTFRLPDLQGRLPMHMGTALGGTTYVIGEPGGTETVTVTTQQLPSHSHSVAAKASASAGSPSGAVYGGNSPISIYSTKAPSAQLNAGVVGNFSGGQAHDNMMPYVVVSFIIALNGIFPSQN
jgi:microcystin-dependent protein